MRNHNSVFLKPKVLGAHVNPNLGQITPPVVGKTPSATFKAESLFFETGQKFKVRGRPGVGGSEIYLAHGLVECCVNCRLELLMIKRTVTHVITLVPRDHLVLFHYRWVLLAGR